jgi:hypothetical protein
MLEKLLNFVSEEWAAIMAAPGAYARLAVVMFLAGFALATLLYKAQADNYKSLADLYRAKLDGASPEDARKRIEQLQEQLQRLMPRHLNEKQFAKIAEMAYGKRGRIQIDNEFNSADSSGLKADLLAAFTKAQWTVGGGTFQGSGVTTAPTGIAVHVVDPEHPTMKEKVVMDALKAAGLDFNIVRAGANDRWDVRLYIDAKVL